MIGVAMSIGWHVIRMREAIMPTAELVHWAAIDHRA
jgi:hypothetical protein